ncbi:MAG: hypothetical protein GEU68_02960 [Actinobacteria bacterium]|nr:hypothetical protein [Actinomycetota bacterium]
MSDMNAYESDMGWLSKLSDEEIEQALAGDYAGGDASLADLAAFSLAAKTTFAAAPEDATRAAHVNAMAEAAADLDVAPAHASKPAASRPIRRVKLVLTSLFASLIAKVALVGLALAATTGGLAAAGSLPEPAQEALARAAEKVGFELPAAGDAEEGEAGVPEGLPESTEGSSAPSVLDVIRSWADDKGCEFGHAVATAAGGSPGPCQDEQGGNDEGEGRPESAGKGRPEGAGKPEGTPTSKPAGAGEGQGKPEGTPSSKPEGAVKPEGTPGGGNPEADGGAGGTGSGDEDRGGASSGSSSSNGNTDGADKPSSVPGGRP